MICQLTDCLCFATWALGGADRSTVRIPPEEELASLRRQLQRPAS